MFLFRKKPIPPVVGSIWKFTNPVNPFKRDFRYEIIEVRDDWVRFQQMDDKKTYDAKISLFYEHWSEDIG